MRIGIVCYPTYGGSGVVATEVGLGLARKGHEVHFITYRRPARLSAFQTNVYLHEVNSMDYPLFEFKPYETALASKLVDVIKREKIDVLHVHYAIPHAAVAFMTKQILISQGIHIPVITTLHGTDITLVGSDPSFHPVVEFSINSSDGVTAVSNYLKEETCNKFNITTDIEVIYNFIDFDRFSRIEKPHFKKAIAPNDEKVLVHVSNFRRVKRVGDIILAFQKIQEQLPSKLLLIGDGPERQSVESLSRELDLTSDVRFLGKQDAIEELLAISDLFLIPSANESFGLAALEAMACEVPVVSSNIGGLPEVNIDGVTGHLCEVGDYETIARRAMDILQDPEVHRTFQINARKQAERFDINLIIPKYESYYARVIEESKKTV